MAYVNDKLYNGYVRRNMAQLVNAMKVSEIMPYLACLTNSDRDEIEAKREARGNWSAMQCLLDCLRRRENWPQQFITALEQCEHPHIADEMRAEYNALTGLNQSSPVSPPSTVVTVHVHRAPAANQPLSVAENVGNNQAAISPPPVVAAEPDHQALRLPGEHVSPNQEAQLDKAAPKSSTPHPDLPLQTPESPGARLVCPPQTPPPSPEIPPHQANAPLPPQGGDPAFQHLVENVASATAQIHDEASSAIKHEPADRFETASSSELESTLTATITGSVSTILTPMKLPVQDTTPTNTMHMVTAAVLQPADTSQPATTQVPVNHIPAVTTVGAHGANPAVFEEDTVCQSKPGPLISVQPNNVQPFSTSASEAPYSGNSGRLELSDPMTKPESTSQESRVPSYYAAALAPASYLSNQENGIQNQPEENVYESLLDSSLGEQEVLGHTVQVTELPYFQNQHGQTPSMLGNLNQVSHISVDSTSSVSLNLSCHSCEGDRDTEQVVGNNEGPQAQIFNGQSCNLLTREPINATGFTAPVVNPSSVSFQHEDQQEEKVQPYTCASSSKLFLVAAGVAACALLVAWKLKH